VASRFKGGTSDWFENPYGSNATGSGELAVTFKVEGKDGHFSATLKQTMDFKTCKTTIMAAAGIDAGSDLDTVAVFTDDETPKRVPCIFEAFKDWAMIIETLKAQGGPIPGLVIHTTVLPWQRALERADMVRYMHDKTIKFQPADNIFYNKTGVVDDQTTPVVFVGATLCNQWEITSYIQSGSFGRGWVAHDKAKGSKHFIKTFRSFKDRPPTRSTAEKQEVSIRKEIEVLLHPLFFEATDHDSVVANLLCYGPVTVPGTGQSGEMFFIETSDLCEGGELFNYLVCTQKPYVRPLSEHAASRMFHQLASGVAHLHKVGCYHRDLKLENLVLSSKFDLKIMDFGSVKFADQMEQVIDSSGNAQSVTSTFADVGTNAYKPPESRSPTGGAQHYAPGPVDVWACGAILFFMIAGDKLYNDKRLNFRFCFKIFEFMTTDAATLRRHHPGFEIYTTLLSKAGVVDQATGAPPHTGLWKYFGEDLVISNTLKDLLNRMFNVDASKRITIDKILDHPWFEEFDDVDEKESDLSFMDEMRARPTSISVQRLTVPTSDINDAIKMTETAVLSALTNGDSSVDTSELCVVNRNRIEAGLDDQGYSLYSLIVGRSKNPEIHIVLCQWQGGDLASWLDFIVQMKESLGGDEAK